MTNGNFTKYAQAADDRGELRLAKRIRIEGRIASALVAAILSQGLTISVNDGEEWSVKRSTDRATIFAELFATDQDTIVARNAEGAKLGWFMLIYGNDGYDVISDYSANDWSESIWEGLQPIMDKAEEEMA